MNKKEKDMEILLLRREIKEIKELTEKAIKILTSKKEKSEILLRKLNTK